MKNKYTTDHTGIELIKTVIPFTQIATVNCYNSLYFGWAHSRTAIRGSIDELSAEILLINDLIKVERDVNKLVTVDLEQDEFNALVSFVFCIGTKNFKKSNVLELINAGNKWAAANKLLTWNHLDGVHHSFLDFQRNQERMVFLSASESIAIGFESMTYPQSTQYGYFFPMTPKSKRAFVEKPRSDTKPSWFKRTFALNKIK